MSRFPVIFVLGPTAVGKSAFAHLAAQKWGGAIMNCDSVQCYDQIQIGAAKPSAAERAEVHYFLLDWVAPPQALTVAKFRAEALKILTEQCQRRPVFAVGGSGFYVRALETDLFMVKPIDPVRRHHWQERGEKEGGAVLHAELQRLDPAYAEKISPNDTYRILRALMIMESEQRTMTAVRQEFNARKSNWPFTSIKLGFKRPREELKVRVEERAKAMVANGFEQEVKKLLAQGWREWSPLKSVGYKEMVDCLDGKLGSDQLIPAMVASTLRLAKKQMTWFRSDPDIEWFEAEPSWQRPFEFLKEKLSSLT